MFSYDFLLVLILVFVRISSMFSIIPLFGAKNTPVITKIGFIIFIALIITPMQVETFSLEINDLITFAQYLAIESIIGFSFGLVTLIILNTFYLAGTLVDRNIGFAMVSVLSAQDESQLPVSANFYYIFAMMIFIITNVHHLLIKAIYDSYATMPIGSNPFMKLIIFDYLEILQYSFVVGFQIAAPFILTILIVNILLGLLSKAMPGMNVFMIGMPLKILVGLIIFGIIMPLYFNLIVDVFTEMMLYIYRLMGIG